MLIWGLIGIAFFGSTFVITDDNIAAQQLILKLLRTYIILGPLFVTVLAIIQRKNIIITSVICAINYLVIIRILMEFDVF